MEKNIVIFDLDGTLADCSHRVHHITSANPKNWGEFFKACARDKPIWHVIKILNVFNNAGYEIWVVSGRSDEVRHETETWLRAFDIPYHKLIMRKSGDYTDDGILKPSWLADGTIPQDRVLMVFDDRKRVVDAWRKVGLPCLQVADGDF